MQRPDQVTLRHLLGEITNLTGTDNAYESDTYRGVSMHYPDSQMGTASIRRFKDRASLDDPNRLAGITHIERVGNEGDEIITNYFILDSPDGLQFDKHSHQSNPRKEVLCPDATLDEMAVSAMNGIARMQKCVNHKPKKTNLDLVSCRSKKLVTFYGY